MLDWLAPSGQAWFGQYSALTRRPAAGLPPRQESGNFQPGTGGLARIGLIPETRKTQGFVRNLNNADNMALASLNQFTRREFVSIQLRRKTALDLQKASKPQHTDSECLTENSGGATSKRSSWQSESPQVQRYSYL